MKLKVSFDEADMRLDAFLAKIFVEISRSKIQKQIEEVKVNNEVKKPSYKLKVDDIVEFEPVEHVIEIKPQNIKLDIRYEDEDMLVINKPKNMLTHPTTLEVENTLVNALLNYSPNLSDVNGFFRKGIVHRLDRNTSGLLMVAKNNFAHVNLARQIKEKTAIRKYLGVVKGAVTTDGIIDKPIGRNFKNPHKMGIRAVEAGGKPSVTKYHVLENFKDGFEAFTFLEFQLLSGRTHQIRVHLSSENHPIYGDSLYGGGEQKVKTTEQVLQSYFLNFKTVKENKDVTIEIEQDEDIKKVLKYLRSKI